MEKIKKLVEIDYIKLDDNLEFPVSLFVEFIDFACDFENTIDVNERNYTNNYFYFETQEEKKFAEYLLKENIIRLSLYHEEDNKYWLDVNYHNFVEKFYNIIYEKK